MKQLITVSILSLFAFTASAQYLPMARPDSNGIVYSMNPIPPIVSNNRIALTQGSPYVDKTGVVRACSTPLVVDYASGSAHAVCGDKSAAMNTSAARFANLAPAAGGPQTLTDRNLPSDTSLGLRSDSNVLQ